MEPGAPTPLNLLDDESYALGMIHENHECTKKDNPFADIECECETREFSSSSCAGCGSTLAGSRHAMTVFDD